MKTEVLDRPTAPVTARPKTAAEILDTAALLIEEHGWIQGTARNEHGYCVVGAILEISRTSPRMNPYREVLKVLGRSCGSEIVDWNDTPGRQAWEVTAALRQAAKRARASE